MTTSPNPEPTAPTPSDRPGWITEDLIALTRKVWQRYYPAPLSRAELIEMILSMGRLQRTLAQGP